jgi:PHS family inorganic phosphate transporter-like MFS transporter
MGFFIVSVLYFVLAGAYTPLQSVPTLLIILYGSTYFFKNFGPNATTYVIPGEYYPTEVKATLHGASAAAGKIGAGIAAETFPLAVEEIGRSR